MTNSRGLKKIIALLTCFMLILTTFTGFAYQDGFGIVSFESSKEIFEGVNYGEIIGENGTAGIEHAHVIQVDSLNNGIQPMIFTGEVRSTYTLSNMIKYAEEQGYKVLAGINGDIFDTATGVPKGLTISQGNIITSGYAPDRSLVFDQDGKGEMQTVNVTYGLKGSVNGMEETTTAEGIATSPAAVQMPFDAVIGFINVPQGGAKGLHFFNRHYSKSTRTGGSCTEVVIETGSTDGIQLKINGSIKGIVKSVQPNTSNTPIGETEVVLSTVSDSSYASILNNMSVGSEVEISATDNNDSGLAEASSALGIYYSIVANGKVDTTGTNKNPRTVVGIKEDGTLVLYVVDGRQPSVSNGLGLIDTARHMISLGCVSAFNMDGGGSSALYARFPGLEANATLKNSPAQSAERSVSNGLLLVYKETAGNTAEKLNVYPALTLAMPGADVQIKSYASNRLYEKVSLPGAVTYGVSRNNGKISMDGIFTAGSDQGRVVINATSGKLTGSTEVEIVHPMNLTFSPSVSTLNLDINQTADVNMNVKTGVSKVNSKDSLFTWSCDSQIGTIDEEGKFKAASVNGVKGNITVEYGSTKISIPVLVGKEILDFSDTIDHWARDYIGKMAASGLVSGVGDNMFMPNANITRAQFLAMLSKAVPGINLDSYGATGFVDVTSSEWYYKYVNWGYANSIVNGLDEKTFAPDANITREQMTIMLCNFSRAIGVAIPQTDAGTSFPDSGQVSPWAADYVATVVGGGIMNGDSSGMFIPQGLANRAQAAKVVYVYTSIKDGIE